MTRRSCVWTRLLRLARRSLPGLCCLAFAVGASALEPDKNITQYGHDSWTQQNGLPGRSVYQVLQGGDGYLWLHTSVGLVRFDGVRFLTMSPKIGGDSLHEPIVAICKGADGSLLLRSQKHTMRYSGGRYSDILPPAMLRRGNPQVILQTRQGDVIIGTDGGLSILRGSEDRAEMSYTGWIQGVIEDSSGVAWAVGSRGLYRYEHGVVERFPLWTESMPTPISLAEDRDHSLLIGTMNGLFRMDAARRRVREVRLGVGRVMVHAMLLDHDGNLWIGTNGRGLWRLRDGRVTTMRYADGLSDDDVKTLAEDREGGLWVGTAGGLDHFRDSPLTTYTAKDGLLSNEPDQIIEARDGAIWIFCQGGGLMRLKDGKTKSYTRRDGMVNVWGNGLFESRDGSVWAGATGGLARVMPDGRLRVYKGQGHFVKPDLSAISEDDEGMLVANNESTVFRLRDNDVVEPYAIRGRRPEVSSSGVYTYTILKDKDGSLWFGATDGLHHTAPWLPTEKTHVSALMDPVASIADDGRGYLWLGGYFSGIVRVRKSDGQMTRFALEQGLFDSFAATVLADRNGDVWASSSDGIYHALRAQLDAVADGRLRAINVTKYGVEDGMKSSEAANKGHQPGGVLARDGRMWFATKLGVVVIDPRHLALRRNAPQPVVIEDFIAAGQSWELGRGVELPPGKGSLEIHYTSLSLSTPQRTRFRYMLEGYDRDWVEAGSRRVAYYTNLPPGRYRFRVIACNELGEWGPETSLDLSMLPHFYETPWFMAAMALLATLLVLLAHLANTRRLRRQAVELSGKVAERTRDLESQRAFLRNVIDISPDLIYVKDKQSRFVLVNQAVADIRGVPVEELLGTRDQDIKENAEENDSFARDDREVLSSGREKYVHEERLTDHEGRVRWLQTVKRPIIGPDGATQYLLGVSMDITERRKNEEQMRMQASALEAASNAIVITNFEDNRILWINSAFTRLTGVTAEEAIGRNRKELRPHSGQDAQFAEADRTVAEKGSWRGEVQLPGADGLPRVVDITLNAICDADGKPQRLIAIIQDISEQRELERRLSQAQKMEAVGNLAGGVAHDFNNMMQVVLGHLDILNRQIPADDPNRRRLAQMRDAAMRSAGLTKQLLAFSSRQVLQPVVMDLNETIAEVEHMLRRLISEDIRLQTRLAEGLGRVKADPTQVEQIIVNLAVNARDAMPQGGELTISTSEVDLDDEFVLQHPEAHRGRHVLLEVQDTGVGMSDEVQAHVFEPFYTTKGFGKGTGLGLATVYGIVRQSGGYVYITSGPTSGTVFHVYLPRVEGEPERAREEAAPSPRTGRELIMVVEDNAAILAMASEALTENGYKVISADSPMQALRMFEEKKEEVSLLITDVVMPEMSGPAMAEKMVAFNPRLHVLYISGYTNEIVLRYGGMDFERGFLQKPFVVDQLLAKVREMIDAPSSTSRE